MRLITVVLLAMGCATEVDAEPGLAPSAVSPNPDQVAHADVMMSLDAALRVVEARAMRFPGDWGRWAEVADQRLARAKQSGVLDDYARAQDALNVAFDLAPDGSGPHLTQARLHYALHRLDAAEASLAKAERRLLLDDNTRSEHLRMRGDLALQRGNHAEAEAKYRASLTLHATMAAEYGLTQVAWQRGAYQEALEGLDGCEAHVVGDEPTTRMWLDLQRGLVELSREHYAAALVHYRAADAHVAEHWLVREHIAEILTLQGDTDDALALYQEILLDTHNPEFMDAVAGILIERGDDGAAKRYVTWAASTYERQLAAFPEAAAGHALDHFLTFGEDPARTLALAEANAALRPNTEALTQLATAYRQIGRHRDAAVALDRAAASGARSVDAARERVAVCQATSDAACVAAAMAEVADLVR